MMTQQSALLMGFVVLMAACGSKERTTPVVYLIPEGFAGWVTIEFAVPGAPALPDENGARLIRVPSDGKLQTSSPQELGIINHRFYYADARGERTSIPQPAAQHGADPNSAYKAHPEPVVLGFGTGSAHDATGAHVYEHFYVGLGPAGDPPTWQ